MRLLFASAVVALAGLLTTAGSAQAQGYYYRPHSQLVSGDYLVPAYVLANGRIQRTANVYAVDRILVPESYLPQTYRVGTFGPSGSNYTTRPMPRSSMIPSRLRTIQAQQYQATQRSISWSVGLNLGIVSFSLSGN